MNDKTQAFFKFIKECYNNSSITRNSAEIKVLNQMGGDTDNLGLGFRLDTLFFEGVYPDRESLAVAVEFSLKDGLQTLQENSSELFEESKVGVGDVFFDHHTYIVSVESPSIQWRELTESLWGDDMDKLMDDEETEPTTSPTATKLPRNTTINYLVWNEHHFATNVRAERAYVAIESPKFGDSEISDEDLGGVVGGGVNLR